MKPKINKRKVCCISDLHIGVHQNSMTWHNIAIEWAGWLKQQLKRKKVTDIIIAGDLFHYRDEIAVNTIHVVTGILNMWSEFNIILLVGNHDAYYKDRSEVNSLSIISGWSNITVISTPTTCEWYNKRVTICPWGTETRAIDKCDILFGHFEIQSFKFNQYKVCDTGMRATSLLKKSPLTITGHFHLREERNYKSGTILYLGNPFQMDFGDVYSTKGYYLLDIPTGEFEFFENTVSPTHQKVKLSELVEYKTINRTVKNIFKNNIVKLIIDKQISPDDMDILLKKLLQLESISITADYDVNFNKFGLDSDEEHDLSGVDITIAIEEFVNLLEDIPNKDEIIEYTIELYNKCK
jgi:DNA repair exonuclease SbcCD nuclease subunit